MTTEHHQAEDRLLSDSIDILSVPEVRLRLGEYAVNLSEAVERVTFVGTDNANYVSIPHNSQPDAIPVLVRKTGERAILHANDSSMNNKQIGAIGAVHGSAKASIVARKFDQHMRSGQKHRILPAFEDDTDMAIAGSNFWTPDPNTIVSGRPYVSMNMESAIMGRLSPIAFLHEMWHVVQRESDPIGEIKALPRAKVKRELEAYHVAAGLIKGMKDSGRRDELLDHTPRRELDRARKIEAVRREARRDTHQDPFEPDNKVVRALVDSGLAITTKLGDIIRTNKK